MKLVTLITLILTMASSAHALFEVRAGYGLITPSKDFATGESIKTMYGFNADIIVKPPVLPFGLGIRYENLSSKFDAATLPGVSYDFNATNIGLLVNYRIIDTLFYVGPIAFVGLSNNLTGKTTIASITTEAKYKSNMVYSLGVEAGAKLVMLNVGAELGYNFYKYTPEDTTTGNTDLELNGMYAKVLVGFGF